LGKTLNNFKAGISSLNYGDNKMRLQQLIENSIQFDENFRQNITDIIVFFKANGVNKTTIDNIVEELEKASITATYDQVEKAMLDLNYNVEDGFVIIEPEVELTEPSEEKEKESDITKMAKKQALK
jgi:hypothetical protein